MVTGLDIFKKHFAEYTDRYVLIGGTASSLAMEMLGQDFRATKDLDIVLIVEALDPSFAAAFWEFVKAGGYENRQKSSGKRLFYRFYAPKDRAYPEMLELFSRVPDVIDIDPDAKLTPIPVGEEASSLSAILMDEEYYQFVCDQRQIQDGLTYLGAEALIPLKAHAYLDLRKQKESGERIDSKNIKKHKNDIFRLFTVLDRTKPCLLPSGMKEQLKACFDLFGEEEINLKPFGIRSASVADVLNELEQFYELSSPN
jgi:hypothetical protein